MKQTGKHELETGGKKEQEKWISFQPSAREVKFFYQSQDTQVICVGLT